MSSPSSVRFRWDPTTRALSREWGRGRAALKCGEEVRALLTVDRQLRWNARRGRPVTHLHGLDSSVGDYIEVRLLDWEDPSEVTTALRDAELRGDPSGVLALVARRREAIPHISGYLEGRDMYVRLDTGEVVRVYPSPSRSHYYVSIAGRTPIPMRTLPTRSRVAG